MAYLVQSRGGDAMSATISVAQNDIFSALRSLLVEIVSSDCEIVHGMNNNAPAPLGDFIVFTPLFMQRLATNETSYADPTPTTGTKGSKQSIQYTFQIDCYGHNAADNAAKITTLWRDDYSCQLLGALCQPLEHTTPKLMPWISSERNYVPRYEFEVTLQYKPITTTAMQFADTVGTITLNQN